jgi:hypothetical protein
LAAEKRKGMLVAEKRKNAICLRYLLSGREAGRGVLPALPRFPFRRVLLGENPAGMGG